MDKKLWRITRKSLNRISDTIAEAVITSPPVFGAEDKVSIMVDGFRVVVTMPVPTGKGTPKVDAVCTNRHIVNPSGLVEAVEIGYKDGIAYLEEDVLNVRNFS